MRLQLYGDITNVEANRDGTLRVEGVIASSDASAASLRKAVAFTRAEGPIREQGAAGVVAVGRAEQRWMDADGNAHLVMRVVDREAVLKLRRGIYCGFVLGDRTLTLVDRPTNKAAASASYTHTLGKIARGGKRGSIADLHKVLGQIAEQGAHERHLLGEPEPPREVRVAKASSRREAMPTTSTAEAIAWSMRHPMRLP
jgi:hypothetical protein